MPPKHSNGEGGCYPSPLPDPPEADQAPLPRSVVLRNSRYVNAHARDDCIRLDEARHVYEYTDADSGEVKEFPISVSGVWGRYFEPFDPVETVSKYYAKWANDPQSQYHETILSGRSEGRGDDDIQRSIMDGWAAKGAEARTRGTYMHQHIEYALNDLPYDGAVPEMVHFVSWVHDVAEARGWQLYRTEWSIYDLEFQVAGQIDAVFKDTDGCLHMVDWKRCREPLDPEAKRQFNRFGLAPLGDFVDNTYSHYTVQQNLYNVILKREYDIQLASMTLVRCHPEACSYQAILVPVLDGAMLHVMLSKATQPERLKTLSPAVPLDRAGLAELYQAGRAGQAAGKAGKAGGKYSEKEPSILRPRRLFNSFGMLFDGSSPGVKRPLSEGQHRVIDKNTQAALRRKCVMTPGNAGNEMGWGC